MLELLLVVVIVAGLAAVVWPRLARLGRALEVRSSARDLVGLVGRARLEALTRREPVQLRLAAEAVSIVRPQARWFPAEARAGEEPAPAPTAKEVTVLEYPLSPGVLVSRLQVQPANRIFVSGQDEGPQGAPAASAPSDSAGGSGQDTTVINFYPDGTSDDALVGLRSADSAEPGSLGSGVPWSGSVEERSEYYVKVRGLVARAVVVRHLSEADEQLFAEVPDAARY